MLHAFSPWCHMLALFYMHLHSNEKPFMHVVIEYLTDKILQKIKTHSFVGIEPTRFNVLS